MLYITCPWCGPREEVEFRHGGEGAAIPAQADDATWARVLYVRSNPLGVAVERWVHVHGCRQWFAVERHTMTHEIGATWPLDAPPGAAPDAPDGGRPARGSAS